jgi:catechol 2,3-dioxygenase-like lactoylglutathione lyase family enzyme
VRQYTDAVEVLGLDHVQVAAPRDCEAAARAFYGRLLGLSEIDKPEPLRRRGGVWFSVGVHQLHVGVAEDFTPSAKAHPALAIDPAGLDRLVRRLEAAGVALAWDEAIPGRRRCFCADPWGNRIELVAAPGPAGSRPRNMDESLPGA